MLQCADNVDFRGAFEVRPNGLIAFHWEVWSAAGEWFAFGTLEDDSLAVQYDTFMHLTDFEDAVYVLRP